MDEVIVFDKSLQQRLREYLDVLGNHNLPVSQIQSAWSFYLELAIDTSGWQAIWKICRATCESLHVSFPTLVLVYVEDVDVKNHKACVRILAVQDDISLPERHFVPLTHLFPTKDQAKSVVLNMQSTANALDLLRFFYNNIIAPWDFDEDDTSDWVSKHLEARLRLYYDMKNGVVPRPIAEHTRALFIEARRLQTRKEQLELEIDRDDLDENDMSDKRVQGLMELHVKLMRIKGEVEILENPLLRNVVVKQKEQELILNNSNEIPQNWVITQSSSAEDYITFLKDIKKVYPKEILVFSYNFLSTLDSLRSSDKIILNKTKHHLETVGKLQWGGQIKGMYAPNLTEITSNSDDVTLDFSGEVYVENLTINAEKSQCAMLVRLGKVTLKNCKLTGKHQGIIVLNESHLVLENCEVMGFSTALVGNSGSKIDLIETRIHHVEFGVKMYDGCVLNANKTTINNCKQYGFCVETTKSASSHQVGTFEILKQLSDITVEEVQGTDNGKGDVSINRMTKLMPFKNLFADLDSDDMDTDSEEDKENTNDTIIQVEN